MNSTIKQRLLEQKNKQSICWDCANCYGGCSWSERFIPVAGWEAEQRNISGHNKGEYEKEAIISYRVDKCPMFVQDVKTK